MRTGKTFADAERRLVESLRARTSPTSDLATDTRLSDLVEDWWSEFKTSDRSDGTRRRYRQVIDRHILTGLGGIRISEASVSRLDRFIKAKTSSAGPATAKICAVVLSGAFDLAARHDTVRANPMRSVAPIPTVPHEIKAHTIDQISRLRTILREWDAKPDQRGMRRVSELPDVVDMFLATGCRTGEILALEWSAVDLKANPARVSIVGTVVNGSNGLVIQRKTKSDMSRRTLRLPPFAEEMLRRRNEAAASILVFPSSTGTLRAPNNFLLQWHAALKGTEFEGEIPKTFRSTVATLISEADGPDRAKNQLGHGSQSVTDKHYIKPTHQGPDVTDTLQQLDV